MDGGAWKAAIHGVAEGRTRLSDFTFTFHFHALEKEMATHSSVLAWRIPGTGEPSGLPSMGSHRVGHDWSDLAAAAVGWWSFHTWTQDPSTQIWECLVPWYFVSAKAQLEAWPSLYCVRGCDGGDGELGRQARSLYQNAGCLRAAGFSHFPLHWQVFTAYFFNWPTI